MISHIYSSLLAEISNLAVSAVLTSFYIIFIDWQKCTIFFRPYGAFKFL